MSYDVTAYFVGHVATGFVLALAFHMTVIPVAWVRSTIDKAWRGDANL